MLAPKFRFTFEPPIHGWLTLIIEVNGSAVEIDASDVPNNPIEDLLAALELAANGVSSSVFWNLEPDGYYMYFTPCGDEVQFKLEFARNSEASRGETVLKVQGSPAHILLPFWRFVREFQSRAYSEPHWPVTDYSRVNAVKEKIKLSN